MPRKNEVAEVFIKVVADSKEALKGIAKQIKATEALAQQQEAMAKAAEQQSQKIKNSTEKQKKALDDLAKKNKDLLKNKLKEADYYKEEEARLKRHISIQEKERNAREKSIRSFAKEAKRIEAAQRDYNQFLERSHRENSRFFDKLSRQDFTRSFTENFRRGMQKGKLLTTKFHPDENYLQGMSRSLGIAATALDRTKSYAERAAEGFYRLQAVGMTLQSGLGLIGGTIGDLIGGIMSLVAVAGELGVSLVAVGGAFASVGAGMIGAKFALEGVGQAVGNLWTGQQQYNRSLVQARIAMRNLRFEAESAALSEQGAAIALTKARMAFAAVQDLPSNNLVYQDALLALQEAELGVRKAKSATQAVKTQIEQGGQLAVVMANSPFKNLTKTQVAFTKWLLTLKPQIQALKEVAAQSFLPPLQHAIQTMVTYGFPMFSKGLKNVNTAMGQAANIFADTFKNPAVTKGFVQFTKDAQPVILDLGKAMSSAFGGLINVLNAAAPITKRFADWVAGVAKHFQEWSSTKLKDGSLTKFFNKAGDVASRVGNILKTVFGGITNDMNAAFPDNGKGGGWKLLDWFQAIANTFKNWTGGPNFSKWLNDSTGNITATIDTIGQFAHVFIDLAGNPDVKKFWVKIRDAAPDFAHIFTEGVKAAPIFADAFNSIVHFISVLADSGAIKSFASGVGQMFGVLSKLVDIFGPLINFLAQFHGWIIALWLASKLFKGTLKVALGYGEKFLKVLGGGQSLIGKTWASSRAAINLTSSALGKQLTVAEKLKITLKTLFGQNIIQRGITSGRNFDQLRAQALALYGLNEKTLKSRGKDTAAARAAFRNLETELLAAKSQGVVALGQFVAGEEAANSGLRSMYYGSYLLYKTLNGIKTLAGTIGSKFKQAFGYLGESFKKLGPIFDKLSRPIRTRWAMGGNQISALESAVSKIAGREITLNGILRTRLRIQALLGRSAQVTEGIGERNYKILSASLDKMKSMGLISAKERRAALNQMKDRRTLMYYGKRDLTAGMGVDLNKFRFYTENVLGKMIVRSAIFFDNVKIKARESFNAASNSVKSFATKFAKYLSIANLVYIKLPILKGKVKLLKGFMNLLGAAEELAPYENMLRVKLKNFGTSVSNAFKLAGYSIAKVGLKAFVKVVNVGFKGLSKLLDVAEELAPYENMLRVKVKDFATRVSNVFKIAGYSIAKVGLKAFGKIVNAGFKGFNAILNVAEELAPYENMLRVKVKDFATRVSNIFKLAGYSIAKVGIKAFGKIVSAGFKGFNAILNVAEELAPYENMLRVKVKGFATRVANIFKLAGYSIAKVGLKGFGAVASGLLSGFNGILNFVEKLAPIENKIRSSVKNVATNFKAEITDSFRVAGIAVRMTAGVLKTSLGFIGSVIKAVFSEVSGRLKSNFTKVFKEIASSPQITAIKNSFYKIRNVFKGAWDEISSTPAFNIAVTKINAFAKKIKDAFKNINGGPGAGGAGITGLNNKLKTLVNNSKIAQSAVGRVKTAVDKAFGPTSKIGSGFTKMNTGINSFITKMKEATGTFKKFFNASKGYETASYASGINQALDQVGGGNRFTTFMGKVGRGAGTLGRYIGKGALRTAGAAGSLGGIASLAQAASNDYSGQGGVTTTGDILMSVGGAVSMFAPEVGVPLMVGAAIVTQIGKSMDAAAEKAKQIAIKSAVVNIANQTNSLQAVSNLQQALGITAAEAVKYVAKYNQGGSEYKNIVTGAQNLTGTTFINSGQGKGFVAALQAAVSSDSTLMTAVKANGKLYPTILKLGIALQQQNQMLYKINTSDTQASTASALATVLSNTIANDPTLSKLTSQINGIIISNMGGAQTSLTKTQSQVFQNIIANSENYKLMRNQAATSSEGTDQFSNLQAYQNAQYALAKDIQTGAYQNATNESQRLIMAGYGDPTKLYQKRPQDGSIDYSKAVDLKTLLAGLKAEGILGNEGFTNPKKAPQIVVKGDITPDQQILFNNINKALMLAWNSK